MTSGPHSPEDPQSLVDARFRDIVAGFGDACGGGDTPPEGTNEQNESTDQSGGSGPGDDATHRWPARGEGAPNGAPPRSTGDRRAPAEPQPWRLHQPPEDPEADHFVPPRPTPPPGHDAVFWSAFVGCVVGPLWFIYLVLTDPYGARTGLWGAGLLTLCGCALIVWRLPKRRDDDTDDGARV